MTAACAARRTLSLAFKSHRTFVGTSSGNRPETSAPPPPLSSLPPAAARLAASFDDASGLSDLHALKCHVTSASHAFDTSVRDLSASRSAVDAAAASHADAHRTHTTLLAGRDTWDATAAASFAAAAAREVSARQQLVAAQEALREAEEGCGRAQREYMDAVRQRYHEENLWQDKWRVLGTYGTWGLIGLNTVVFVGGQFFYRRREEERMHRIEDLIRSGGTAVTDCNDASDDHGNPAKLEEDRPGVQLASASDAESATDPTVPSATARLPPQFLPVREHFHWPSALVGAVSGFVGLCLIVSVGKR